MTGSIKMGIRTILGALTISVAAISVGNAQDINLDELRVSAESGDADAQRKLGEALLYGFGGVEQDKKYGVRLLEQAATTGDPRAQAILGVGLLWGSYSAADPARARTLLEQAAKNNDIEAQRVLGEQLIGGWMFDRDVETGLPMLEKAAAAGDAKAKVVLGSFFFDGTGLKQDQARAVTLFEEAAKAGNGEGLERLGAKLMWAERDPAAAESYLRRAGELGRSSAWTTLAEGAMYGYLGKGSRAKFDGFAEKAREAGEDRIAILEADRNMWGISMRASGPQTIEGLEQAAEAGNKQALKYLIGLVRNGNRMNIRKNTEQATAYLDRFSGLLTPTETAQLSMTIDVAKVKIVPGYKKPAEQFRDRPELKSLWFGKELYAANPNFAIYLLQTEMKNKGTYAGALNGLATRATMESIRRECQSLGGDHQCSEKTLHPDVIGALLAR